MTGAARRRASTSRFRQFLLLVLEGTLVAAVAGGTPPWRVSLPLAARERRAPWPFAPRNRTTGSHRESTSKTTAAPAPWDENNATKMCWSLTPGSFYRRFKDRDRSSLPTRSNSNVTSSGTNVTLPNATEKQYANSTKATTNATEVGAATAPPSTGVLVISPATHATGSRPVRYGMGRGTVLPAPSPASPPGGFSPSTLVLAELLLPVLTLLARSWVVPWVARWLARQQDTVQPVQRFAFERVNDRYARDAEALQTALREPPHGVSRWRWERRRVQTALGRRRQQQQQQQRRLGGPGPPPNDLTDVFRTTVVVVEVNTMATGSSMGSGSTHEEGFDLQHLPDVVSFLLQQHRAHAFGSQPSDLETPVDLEIVLLITSPGGGVASYGLAAAQVQRLAREPGVRLTVCVDQCAASGGYMIASQAHRLLAAPFASIGSIGVIMGMLNFNDLVRQYGVKPVIIKAGESKNTLSRYGDITKKDIAHEKKSIDHVHQAFKRLIVEGRPGLHGNIQKVADGSVWLGSEAYELNLIDQVMTSNEYIQQRVESSDRVLKLHRAYPNRYNFRLPHTLDRLPQLKSWLLAKITTGGAANVLSFLIQTGMLGILHHVFRRGLL